MPSRRYRLRRYDPRAVAMLGGGTPDATWPRGTVTFLLCDVESSVRLWEQYADRMPAALLRHDELIERFVAEHHGLVVRPRGEGDSRFAVFHEPADAVGAACAIQLALQAETWPLPEPLRIRIALHTGPTDFRAGDYYGGTVNRCARVRDLGVGGQILCTSATAALVRERLPVDAHLASLGSHRLRGLREPETIFELLHPRLPRRASVSAAGSTDRLPYVAAYPFPSPRTLVGRESELTQLEWLLARGKAEGQTLFIGAPAGTGKSTLLGALARQANQLGTLVVAGGCYESEALVPLRPFRDALGDYLLTRSSEALRADVGDIADDLSAIVPELRHFLQSGAAVDGEQKLDQIRVFSAVHTLIRRLAQRAPILVCLEDLHVADALTLDLIQYLSRQVHRLPVAIVGTYRSDEVAPGQPLAQLLAQLAREGAEHIDLHGLARDDTGRLASSLLDGTASHRLIDSLFDATEGNPLFIEQLALALREDQRIDRRGGVWHPAGDLAARVSGVASGVAGGSPLPSVIREVFLRRVDRLSETCRETLSLLAVLGYNVNHETLIAVAEPREELEIVGDLDEALSARVLHDVDGGYRFGHALLREAVYQRLSAPRRMLLHARAARSLERLAGSDTSNVAAELAHHYLLSGSGATVREKALRYSLEAGRRAAALSSHMAALMHFRQAADVLAALGASVPVERRLEVLEARGQAERDVGVWEACVTTFREVLAQSSDCIQRARAHGAIGRSFEQLGQVSDAMAAYAEGLAELGDSTDRASLLARLQIRHDEAFCHLLVGRYTHVLEVGREMLTVARRVDEPRLIARANNVMGAAHMWQGNTGEAVRRFRQAIAAAQRSSDQVILAVARENLGAAYFYRGEFGPAATELEAAVVLYQESVSDRRAVLALQILSRLHAMLGEFSEATSLLAHARDLAFDTRDRWTAECLVAEGELNLQVGDWERARKCFSDALLRHEEVGHIAGMIEALMGAATAAERMNAHDDEYAMLVRAAELARGLDPGIVMVGAMRRLAIAQLRRGNASDAAAELVACLELAERMPQSLEYAPALLAFTELTLQSAPATAIAWAIRALQAARTPDVQVSAHVLLVDAYAAVDRRQALEHAQQARVIAERHGAAWLTQRVHDRIAFVDAQLAAAPD